MNPTAGTLAKIRDNKRLLGIAGMDQRSSAKRSVQLSRRSAGLLTYIPSSHDEAVELPVSPSLPATWLTVAATTLS